MEISFNLARLRYWKHYIKVAREIFFEKQSAPEDWFEVELEINQIIVIANEFVYILSNSLEIEDQIKNLQAMLDMDNPDIPFEEILICAEFFEMIIWYIHRRHLGERWS